MIGVLIKKGHPALSEVAQGLTKPIIPYGRYKSSTASVIPEAREAYLAWLEDVERRNNVIS